VPVCNPAALATRDDAFSIQDPMANAENLEKININAASPKQLTQLPGIAKNLAYRIVNHRKRHGFFTHWEELAEVKEFPVEALERIKQRATLDPPPRLNEDFLGPRRIKSAHLAEVKKKPKGYTKAIRSTRSADKMKPPA
jgi:hypothetical protein